MKKISIISILSILTLPTFAEEATKAVETATANTAQQETVASAENAVKTEAVKEDAVVKPAEATDSVVKEEKNIKEEKIAKKETIKPAKEKVTEVAPQKTEIVEQYEKQFSEPTYKESAKYSNPETKFPHGIQLGLGVSPTSGLNAFVGYNNKKFDSFWWKRFGLRFDFATYSPIKNKLNSSINDAIGDDGIKVDDHLKINNVNLSAKHIGALVDFYPFGDTWFLGGLRVSGGYMTGNIDLNADILGTKKIGEIEFELGGRKYKYDGDTMRGKSNVNWKYSGPYLGAGFDLGIFHGFKLYLDAGVVFADNHARVNLDVPITSDLKDITSGAPQDITGEIETKFEEAKAKALKEAQDEMDKVDYYPLVKLGFMYRF